MNIAITDSNYKHSLGIVRQLGLNSFKPYILSFEKDSLCAYSKFANKEIVLDKNYTKVELIEKLKLFEIKLLILVGTNSFMKIVPWKEELKDNGIDMVTVDEQTLSIAFSKKDTYKLAEKIGIPIAKTYYPKSIQELEVIKNIISYPCVIKGLYEVGGNIVDYAYKKDELIDKYVNICDKYDLTEKNGLPMIQEYIEGYGCAFFAIYKHGKCGLTFQHKRVREFPVSGGASVCAESYKNPLIEKYGKMLLDSLNWHGVAMVEFKMNNKNEPILMEINPKFWGSTDLALEAGVNFPLALVNIYQNKEVPFSNSYKYPLRYHWPIPGEMQHAIYNPKAIPYILMDFLNPRVKSNIWLSDFRPTIKMLKELQNSIFNKLMNKGNKNV